MKQKNLTKWLSVFTYVSIGIFFIIIGLSCDSGVNGDKSSAKKLILWSVDPMAEIPTDSVSYDGRWGLGVIACQG